jgi:hypothetical protein
MLMLQVIENSRVIDNIYKKQGEASRHSIVARL